MTVTLKYHITRETKDSSIYQVTFSVVDYSNISPNIFVFNASTGEYSHVSMVYDLETWPTSLEDATKKGLDFYRLSSVTRQFSTIADAVEFDTITRNRIKLISTAWKTSRNNFDTSEIVSVGA